MKPIDQLVLDIALAMCATGFVALGSITGPGLGWMLFAVAVLLYALLRVLCALHHLVPGGFADEGLAPTAAEVPFEWRREQSRFDQGRGVADSAGGAARAEGH